MKRWMRPWWIGGLLVAVLAALTPRGLPLVLSAYRPDLLFTCDRAQRTLYLTIDDAPSEATAEILRVLAKHKVRATFFVIGRRVRSSDDLAGILASGGAIGHHMLTTERCSQIPIDRFREEFIEVDTLLRGFGTRWFRPPSDFGTQEQLAFVRERGYTPVLGTVFPLDHWLQHPRLLRFLIRWLAVPGGILVMHDGANRGRVTAEVLDRVLPELEEAGYSFAVLPAPPEGSSSTAQPTVPIRR